MTSDNSVETKIERNISTYARTYLLNSINMRKRGRNESRGGSRERGRGRGKKRREDVNCET